MISAQSLPSYSTLAEENHLALNSLVRAIYLSQGQSSLILASCNDSEKREQLIAQLKTTCTLPLQEITLHPAITNLFRTLQKSLQHQTQPPNALMVMGLENIMDIDRLLMSVNLLREEFRQTFSFPLILWINDTISLAMRRLMPDLRGWVVNPIRFETIPYSVTPTVDPQSPTPDKKVVALPPFLSPSLIPYQRYYPQATGMRNGFSEGLIQYLKMPHGVTEMVIVEPSNLGDLPPLIDAIRTGKSVLLNVRQMSPEESQRAVDFMAGGTFSLDGDQQRIGKSIFLFTPYSMKLSVYSQDYTK